MANVAFLVDDVAAAGTASASSSVGSLPGSRLLTAGPRDVWRGASGVTSLNVTVDLGVAKAIDAVALLFTNLSASGTRRVRVSNNSDMSSASYDTTQAAPATGELDIVTRQLVHVLPATATGRYVRVNLVDATLSYHEAGKFIAGALVRPARNFAHGRSWDAEDPSRISRAYGGAEFIDLREIRRILELELPALTPAEAEAFGYDLLTRLGSSQPFLTILDPAGAAVARNTVWGRCERPPKLAYPNVAMRRQVLRILERFA